MNVLIAIDDSEPSKAAVAELAAYPWPAATTIRVLTVAPTAAGTPVAASLNPGVPLAPVSLWAPELEGQNLQLELAARIAQDVADALAAQALRVEARTAQGSAGPMIVREASEWPADLVVMGSRGHGALKRLWLGSVAHHVLNHAPCSIRIVRSSGSPE